MCKPSPTRGIHLEVCSSPSAHSTNSQHHASKPSHTHAVLSAKMLQTILHSGSTAERTRTALQPRSANSFRLWDSTYIGRLCDRMNTAPLDQSRFPTTCYIQWESWDRQKALDWPAKFGSKAAPAFADTVNHIAEPPAPRTHPGKDTHVQHFYLLALASPQNHL